jgi:hypothetical protein
MQKVEYWNATKIHVSLLKNKMKILTLVYFVIALIIAQQKDSTQFD